MTTPPYSIRLFAAMAGVFLAAPFAPADVGDVGPWGDQGDGTYKNPIIPADYSDPDPIRVGQDYYMVASTFQFSPGVVVLHSKDLVNWETLSYAFSDVSVLGPKFNWDKMGNYNEGVYAASIRYHAGKFWVFVNCHVGEGFWMSSATNPAGPWTPRQLTDKNGTPLRTTGWTDVCPLWDDDGKAYLAAAGQQSLWLFQMSPDGTRLLDCDITNKDGMGGTKMWPYEGTEGNKLYKWNGLYYLFNVDFQGKGPLGKGCYWKRSRYLYGTRADGTPGRPGDGGTYDYILLNDESLPTQGGFVDTPDGKWYFIGQFNHLDCAGRYPYLVPATWAAGWLRNGSDVDPGGNKMGKMVWSGTKPVPGKPIVFAQGSDDFDRPTLHPQWQWNHQPRAGFWSLTDRPGHLRLKAFKPLEPEMFLKAGNTLLQRYVKSDVVRAEVKMDISQMADGGEAGLAHFNGGSHYFTLGVVQAGASRKLQFNNNGVPVEGPTLTKTTLYLRSEVDVQNMANFSYSFDGITYSPLGPGFKLVGGGYRGDCIGIYHYNNLAENGWIDLDWFHYTFSNSPQNTGPFTSRP